MYKEQVWVGPSGGHIRHASRHPPGLRGRLGPSGNTDRHRWLGAYKGLAERGYQLEMHVQHGKRDVMDQHLPKVHLFFSNLKTWLNGTFHGASSKYLARYVDEFVYRFNRRSLPNLFDYFCRRAMQSTWTGAAGLAPGLTT